MTPGLTDPDAWLASKSATPTGLTDPDAWLKQKGIGPQLPAGRPMGQQETEQMFKSVGQKALDYLPAAGATIGTMLAPEATLPAVGAAALGGMAGEVIRQGAQVVTGSPGAPQTVGQVAKNVATSGAEQGALELGGRALAYPIGKIAQRFTPEAMYGRELKPSVTLKPSEAAARVQTGLQEGIPVSGEGYEQVGQRIQGVGQQMTDLVRKSPQAQSAIINPIDIAQRLDQLATDSPWAKQALPQGDVATIQAAKRQYLEKHGAKFDDKGAMTSPPQMMTPVETMEEKSATYAVNKKKYEAAQRGGAAVGAADDAAERALARGAKDQLIALYPELQKLGERDQSLYDLEDSLRQFIGRERNRNAIGLRAIILGGSALVGTLAGHPEMGVGAGMMGLALNALDTPEVKSNLAIALARAGQSKAVQVMGALAKPQRSIPTAFRLGQAIISASQPVQP